MMKTHLFKSLNFSFFALLMVITLLGCYKFCETEIDKSNSVEQGFIPKLGNMMLSIQAHHTKLYYAREEENFELSSFLLHELEEEFEDVAQYHQEHDGVDLSLLLDKMAFPAIEELEHAVKNKNKEEFTNGFNQLTNACNSCHSITNHSFIRIQSPKKGDFQNQKFSISDEVHNM